MPETISFWWAAGGYACVIVGNIVAFTWAIRGAKAMLAVIAADAQSALDVAKEVRDVGLLRVETAHNQLALATGRHAEKIEALQRDHQDMREELRDLVMLKLPNQVEEAMKRADASALTRFEDFSKNLIGTISRTAWTKRRR